MAKSATRFTSEQLERILSAVSGVDSANEAAAKAAEARSGAYGTFTALAVEMKAKSFGASMETLFKMIRTNQNDIAKKVNAEPTKKGDAWQVPSSMSSAKSVLLGAFEYGIDLDDEDGVRAFGAIRKDVQAAAKAEKDAERDAPTIARDELIVRLQDMAAALAADKPDAAMQAHYESLQDGLSAWVVEGAKIAGEDADAVAALELALAA